MEIKNKMRYEEIYLELSDQFLESVEIILGLQFDEEMLSEVQKVLLNNLKKEKFDSETGKVANSEFKGVIEVFDKCKSCQYTNN